MTRALSVFRQKCTLLQRFFAIRDSLLSLNFCESFNFYKIITILSDEIQNYVESIYQAALSLRDLFGKFSL